MLNANQVKFLIHPLSSKKILPKKFLGGQRAVCECRDGYEGDPFVRYDFEIR